MKYVKVCNVGKQDVRDKAVHYKLQSLDLPDFYLNYSKIALHAPVVVDLGPRRFYEEYRRLFCCAHLDSFPWLPTLQHSCSHRAAAAGQSMFSLAEAYHFQVSNSQEDLNAR